jgi:hypothetical protein
LLLAIFRRQLFVLKIGAKMKWNSKIFAALFLTLAGTTLAVQSQAQSVQDGVLGGAVNRTLFHSLFPSHEKDEAMRAMQAGTFSQSDFQKLKAGSAEDYFREMDNGVTLPQNHERLAQELSPYIPGITKGQAVERVVKGRNNWMVFTGGNDAFWNYMGRATFGGLDFLKTLSSEPKLPSQRANRWQTLGLVNEPCFRQAAGPDADKWGLWLDKRDANCGSDPYADATKYPGVKIGSRGTYLNYKGKRVLHEVGSSYGYPTGVVGLRLFTNPDFDQKAADKWDPVRYYNDPAYYNDPNTIRPYRVGMACAFCHVGPSPTNPPADFNNPKWANLNSNPGAQYFWVDRIFYWDWKRGGENFVYQLLHTSRPGALDTSLISSDQINNPRTMNAVYDLPARMIAAAKFNAAERLTGDERLNAQFSTMSTAALPESSPLRQNARPDGSLVLSPRVLKDGSDSVGALGALNRVYINIGLFGDEWVRHFIPVVGGAKITPFSIKYAEKNSLYWQANVNQTPDVALFFLASAKPDKLANAPGGAQYLKDINGPEVSLGKKVFAENCAQCHSSKLPEKAYTFFNSSGTPGGCDGNNYMKCWNNFWNYSQTPEFKTAMHGLVMQPNFLEHNFLSNDQRVPVNLTDSQLCSPIATNAIKGDIWDNFSSTSYKNLGSIGKFQVNYPKDSGNRLFGRGIDVPAGGRGFLRPPSLISVWSSAPFLQANTLGSFDDKGTVAGRMSSFNDSINKLLNPTQRSNPNANYGDQYGKRSVFYLTNSGKTLPGTMDVTSQPSFLKIPRGYLPDFLFNIIKSAQQQNPMNAELEVEKIGEYAYLPVGEEKRVTREVASEQLIEEKTKGVKNKTSKKGQRETASIISGIKDWFSTSDPNEMANIIYIGPIPAGVPVNLISNLKLSGGISDNINLGKAILSLIRTTAHIHNAKLTGTAARDYFMKQSADELLAISACADFVVDRGHYFGTQFAPNANGGPGLNAEEKAALIEYLKHM